VTNSYDFAAAMIGPSSNSFVTKCACRQLFLRLYYMRAERACTNKGRQESMMDIDDFHLEQLDKIQGKYAHKFALNSH